MGIITIVALPPRVLVAGRLQCGVPLVRVCAAGVGSVRSWRTWRRAFTTGFTLDMLKNGRFFCGGWDEWLARNVGVVCCFDSGRQHIIVKHIIRWSSL